jgi:hypothetical protein
MNEVKKYLTLAIIAISLPAAAFDGGRGIHIALTGNANSPYAAITNSTQIAEKIEVDAIVQRDVAVAVPTGKTSTAIAGTGTDF